VAGKLHVAAGGVGSYHLKARTAGTARPPAGGGVRHQVDVAPAKITNGVAITVRLVWRAQTDGRALIGWLADEKCRRASSV
jgi:hypothetical protein